MNEMLEKNLAFIRTPWFIGAAAFVVGMIFGLVVLGWWIWPVQWTDASPAHLQEAFQEDYLRMAIDSFTLNGNVSLAQERYQALGEQAPKILEAIRQQPGEQAPEDINAFAAVVEYPGVGMPLQGTPAAAGTEALTPPALASPPGPVAQPTPEGKKGRLGSLAAVLVACGLLLVLLVVGGLVLFLRQKSLQAQGPQTPVQRAQEASREAEYTDYAAEGREPPLAQFMSTYMKGDDLFDESFSIDSPSGEFLGECGVGIADTIGVGETKKVMAFEVWLFDKNDIQTVTKVLMSEHAFNDEAIRQRLATKGEPVLAHEGQTFVLETATLQMVARVVDIEYGDGALPENSYFERLTLELAVWRKEEEAA